MTGHATPLVSVILPIHDGARFLAEALESVAAQHYRRIEVIVVDDGSTDDGAAIAEGHGATVIRQEQRGVAAARNAGIDAARGEILAFIDQDDLWLPAKLRLQVETLARTPDAICLTHQQYFFEQGVERPAWFAKPELLENDHAGWAPSCVAVRRTTFDRVGRYDDTLQHASDSDWIARAKHLGIPFEILTATLVRRRLHRHNDSGQPAVAAELFTTLRRAAARKRSGDGT
jgi:glycosyltransferase involved in cell wall biosynthesis